MERTYLLFRNRVLSVQMDGAAMFTITEVPSQSRGTARGI